MPLARPLSSDQFSHVPVLCAQVVEALNPQPDKIYVDGTFGEGGYSRALLQAAAPCRVYGIDRDPRAKTFGQALETEFPGRFTLLAGTFGQLDHLLALQGITHVHGVCFDLGVSSPQLDDPSRGFSFRQDGPLDMRMSQEGPTAADIVNTLPEDELAHIFWEYGEERMARRVARAIVQARSEKPLKTTLDLANVIRSVVRKSPDGIDPATRSFQGLRIYVNNELEELSQGLAAAEKVLAPGGRLAIVSFHSLEDRIVKNFLRQRSTEERPPSRHFPFPVSGSSHALTFHVINRRPVEADLEEIKRNLRARSARLRVAERTSAPLSRSIP